MYFKNSHLKSCFPIFERINIPWKSLYFIFYWRKDIFQNWNQWIGTSVVKHSVPTASQKHLAWTELTIKTANKWKFVARRAKFQKLKNLIIVLWSPLQLGAAQRNAARVRRQACLAYCPRYFRSPSFCLSHGMPAFHRLAREFQWVSLYSGISRRDWP